MRLRCVNEGLKTVEKNKAMHLQVTLLIFQELSMEVLGSAVLYAAQGPREQVM